MLLWKIESRMLWLFVIFLNINKRYLPNIKKNIEERNLHHRPDGRFLLLFLLLLFFF